MLENKVADAYEYLYRLSTKRHLPAVSNQALQQLLDKLGNPHERIRFVHIGGTAGKGSCAAIIAAMCRCAGCQVGLFTSPHLNDVRERIQINQELVEPLIFEDYLAKTISITEQNSEIKAGISFFGLIFAISMLCFEHYQVDVAMIEVGIGGEQDATNIITPLVSVITTIGYDHQNLLGNDLPSITHAKAGIIKPGVPVVSGATKPELAEIIRSRAAVNGSLLFELNKDIRYADVIVNRKYTKFSFRNEIELKDLELGLLGEFQAHNAALAIKTVLVLQQEMGLMITSEQIREGVLTAYIPARLEVTSNEPLIVIDGSHGPLKLSAAVDSLQKIFPEVKFDVLFASAKRTDLAECLAILSPIAQRFVFTTINLAGPGEMFSATENDLLRASRILDQQLPVEYYAQPQAAWTRVRQKSEAVLVIGSLFVAGYVRSQLFTREERLASKDC